ncbi:PREDICTED: MAP7 domain-containing protein 2 isoform X5 [Polistes canadensis]|uniref:MAP7 domain-containing protein 2 isoform X5 n=1 Tax=Polistes canadensis TaxID=91411 RepID=UPI000718ECCD|nr:PREDICTED: MAP7 domain-containing protein 2 isoform X5 [Polistes canadensis]
MFSELCRETLRKAAVCYSSGRTGSPSPSPPTSPPASPAKEAKIPANVDLGNVRGTGCEFTGSSGKRQTTTATTTTTQPVELRDFREKRPAMPTDFTKRLPGLEARDSGRRQLDECRFAGGGGGGGGGGSGGGAGGGGWGGGGGGGFGEIGEYGRPSSRLGRQSGLSSPESESEFDTSEDNSSTSGDEAGAASEEINQRTSSAHNRHSLTKDVKRRRSLYDEDSLDDDRLDENEARDSTGSAKDVDRARLVRERQNEERQRKLEELRQQALAAQRFREQREEERRKRIDELRSRDNDRRNQVEERKRLICEAERERREAILRKNQEREARIEAKKKNERSHIVFAFGSSTPRMLEPADTGGSTFWGTRRATSTTNVMMFSAAQPLTRRSSERELDGSKKRATSAGGLDRKPGEDMRMSSSMYEVFNWNSSPDPPLTPGKHKRASLSLPPTTDIFAIDDKSDSDTRRPMIQRAVSGEDSDGTPGTPSSVYLRVNRRRTDLMPTIPSPRDGPPTSGRSSSAKAFARSPGIRSGEVTPNSPSRPHSSMSQQSASSVGSSNVNLRPRTSAPRRPRPASIAGTGVSVTERHNLSGDAKLTKDSKPPLPKVHSTPKKPSTPKTSEVKKPTDKLTKNAKASPRITSKATPLQSPGIEHSPLIREATEIIEHEQHDDVKNGKSEERNEEKKDHGSEKAQDIEEAELVVNEVKNEIKNEVKNEIKNEGKNEGPIVEQPVPVAAIKQAKDDSNFMQETLSSQESSLKKNDNNKVEKVEKKLPIEQEAETETDNEEQIDMSASMIAKIRITTEEEAKAALAERRRLAREQAEREAELERLRLEEEARLEAEKLRAEEEEQRRLEEETLRLANEARQAEEQRLKLAIEEAKRREEEDRRRREEEARQKQEKEEAEKKAREEVERQRIEMAERLKKEEEERLARRKRVEAIMLRTRGKNQSNTPTKGEGGDGDKLKEDSPSDENKSVPGSKNEDVMTASLISEATQQFLSGEQRAHHVENVTAPAIVHNGTHSNGINENKIVLDNNQGNVEGGLNGHHTNNHGNEINSQTIALDNATVKQNNVTNNLLDLSEFDTLSNNSSGPTLELTLNMATEDTLNSNLNPAATPFTPLANTFTSAGANANINPFQDAYVNNKQQDSNQMSDLLS